VVLQQLQNKKVFSKFLAIFLALCLCGSLTGCFGMKQEKKVAAYVNGQKIYEKTITNYIEGFRKQEGSYETNSSWAQYLASCGYTAESLRLYVLNSLLIPQALIKQECAKRDISITENELNNSLEAEKSHYELKYGEDTWESILSSYGYDEKSWTNNEEQRMLEERLKNELFAKSTPSKNAMQKELNSNYSEYSGKHSYYVKFDTEDKANSFYKLLKVTGNNKLKKKSKSYFKQHDASVNSGWNCVNSDKQNMTNDYITQLNKLDKNQISKPFESNGYYYIIWCDKTFSADKKTKFKDVPKAIKDEISKNTASNKQDEKFEKWLNKLQNSATIIIADMPQDLPYDVDIPLENK
jgi:parvulin-like peptidyl-prolyl isomerase